MPDILIICTANICRSPVAEAILRALLAVSDSEQEWTVRSAGTWASNGQSAARYSVELMAERGLDLANHRSQIVTEALLAQVDLVLCMTQGHAEALRIEFPHHAGKVFLLSEMIGRRFDVTDPYGGPRGDYEQMVSNVSELLERGLPRIVELATQSAVEASDEE